MKICFHSRGSLYEAKYGTLYRYWWSLEFLFCLSTFQFFKRGLLCAAVCCVIACNTGIKPASKPTASQITITVNGDTHAKLVGAQTFTVQKGARWSSVKVHAEKKIEYTTGYESAGWKIGSSSGPDITDTYRFMEDTTVFAASKKIPVAQITVTVAGDGNVEFKSQTRSFKIDKNKTWADAKKQAEALIKYKTGFEHSEWKLNGASGTVIVPTYTFATDTTVYAVSKQIGSSPDPAPNPNPDPLPQEITITVEGDSHVSHKTAVHTVKVPQNELWSRVKARAADIIKYNEGYENKTWKLTNELGQDIPDNHQFHADTTVYAVSKKIAITITVAGDENVVFKTPDDRTFTAYYGDTWSALQSQSQGKIDYKAGYENAAWKLNNASGDVIAADYRFTTNATVYAESKRKTITITVAGDSHTNIATAGDVNKLKRDYGVTWSEIKTEAGNQILGHDENYTFSAWKLNSDGTGAEIQPTHKFTADTTVYAISKRTHVILTIRGDAKIIVPNPNTHRVLYDSKWEDNKTTVEASLGCQGGFKLKGWKRNGSDGPDLGDSYRFKNDTVIYALSKPDKVKITVKGDEHIQITPAPANEFTADDGAKWETIKATAISKITGYTPRYRLSRWAIDNADGSGIYNDTTFEKDTIVYAVSEELPPAPAYEGVKVDRATITGKNPSCPLPAGADASWKGVFSAGRDVILSSYFIGKNEVTVETWNAVYEWAKDNGYTFEFDEDWYEENPPASVQHPITKVSWRDCIVWCNAYTELTYGTTEHCVYRESSVVGAEALKDANDADNTHFDQSKKGYRLPTEAEWEYAARYQDNATNAEQYGAVYLTKVNSASGAKQPIGFQNTEMPPLGETYETLRTETARVAVFNKYYNGTGFVAQSPAVIGLAAVKSKEANKLGLFDMSGNASEWCWDRYSTTLSSGSVTDPIGSSSSADTERVLRGGNWSLSDQPENEKAVYDCMTGKRDKWGSSVSDPVIGFRLVWKE